MESWQPNWRRMRQSRTLMDFVVRQTREGDVTMGEVPRIAQGLLVIFTLGLAGCSSDDNGSSPSDGTGGGSGAGGSSTGTGGASNGARPGTGGATLGAGGSVSGTGG